MPTLPDHFDLTSLKLNVLLALPCQIKILDKCSLFDSFCNDCTYLIDQYPSLPPADAKLKHFYLFFSIAPVLWSLWSYKPLQGACIVVCEWNTSKYRLQNLQCRCNADGPVHWRIDIWCSWCINALVQFGYYWIGLYWRVMQLHWPACIELWLLLWGVLYSSQSYSYKTLPYNVKAIDLPLAPQCFGDFPPNFKIITWNLFSLGG